MSKVREALELLSQGMISNQTQVLHDINRILKQNSLMHVRDNCITKFELAGTPDKRVVLITLNNEKGSDSNTEVNTVKKVLMDNLDNISDVVFK